MKTLTIAGNLIGVFQKDNDFYARFKISDFEEIDLPIDHDQFQKIKFGKGKLTLEIE